MAQFEICRLSGGQLVVDLQTDLIGLEATRIVAPLREAGLYAEFPGLTPEIQHDGRKWVLRLQEMAAVPAAEIAARVGSASGHRDANKRGIDILIDGF